MNNPLIINVLINWNECLFKGWKYFGNCEHSLDIFKQKMIWKRFKTHKYNFITCLRFMNVYNVLVIFFYVLVLKLYPLLMPNAFTY